MVLASSYNQELVLEPMDKSESTLEGGAAEAGRPDSVDAQHGPQPAWDADVAAGDAAMEEGERPVPTSTRTGTSNMEVSSV